MLTLCHYDDGKEKSQSHECSFRELDESIRWSAKSLTIPITDITGYGENKKEALGDLRDQIKEYVAEIDAFAALYLDTPYWDDDTATVEIDGMGNIIKGKQL